MGENQRFAIFKNKFGSQARVKFGPGNFGEAQLTDHGIFEHGESLVIELPDHQDDESVNWHIHVSAGRKTYNKVLGLLGGEELHVLKDSTSSPYVTRG